MRIQDDENKLKDVTHGPERRAKHNLVVTKREQHAIFKNDLLHRALFVRLIFMNINVLNGFLPILITSMILESL